MKRYCSAVLLITLIAGTTGSETFRTIVAEKLAVSVLNPEGAAASLSYTDSAVITIEGDRRFLRGIELDLRVPPQYLKYRGSMAVAFYAPLKPVPAVGVADLNAERIGFEPLPNKLQTVFHLPVQKNHGLKPSPYVSIPTPVVPASSFPILFRLMPVIKGLPEELESLRFQFHAKPILSEDGAVRVVFKYPEKLKDKPFTLLIDEAVVEDPAKDFLVKQGEHVVTVISEHYRNENRRILVERARTLEVPIELQDPTPIILVEAPENAKVIFDGQALADPREPFPVEPGEHEVRFVIGDYSLVKPVEVRRGRTYKIVLSIDAKIEESE